ncbi:hypothetical protein [Bradyrhizobium sp. S3.2.6]|uniref:ATP-dependent DNA ligase n=1 Tax=Bradyrhizobium sp. S3.2.6 TaxID=3156428 RepID=UPI003390EAF5
MKAPSGGDWIHEIKYDGYRIQLHLDGDTHKAFTRNGHDWIKRFLRHRRRLRPSMPGHHRRRGGRGP